MFGLVFGFGFVFVFVLVLVFVSVFGLEPHTQQNHVGTMRVRRRGRA